MPYREATPDDGEYAYASGCWIWTGYTDPKGVPIVRTETSNTTGARRAWTREHGPVPKGKVIGSLCGTPLCVRPSHHQPMTRKQIADRQNIALSRKQRERATRLASEGWSRRRIAEAMNVDETTIRRTIKREGEAGNAAS